MKTIIGINRELRTECRKDEIRIRKEGKPGRHEGFFLIPAFAPGDARITVGLNKTPPETRFGKALW